MSFNNYSLCVLDLNNTILLKTLIVGRNVQKLVCLLLVEDNLEINFVFNYLNFFLYIIFIFVYYLL